MVSRFKGRERVHIYMLLERRYDLGHENRCRFQPIHSCRHHKHSIFESGQPLQSSSIMAHQQNGIPLECRRGCRNLHRIDTTELRLRKFAQTIKDRRFSLTLDLVISLGNQCQAGVLCKWKVQPNISDDECYTSNRCQEFPM
jgi:hypothetical protein